MHVNSPDFYGTLLSHSNQRSHHHSISKWFSSFISATKHHASTLEQAALGGRLSKNMGFTFAAGYQSAIQSLFQPKKHQLTSLCISEQQGNHPRAIQSALTKHGQIWHLDGSKSFITGASEAKHLYVAATTGFSDNGKPIIKMLSLKAKQKGIQIKTMPKLSFVPEISHGTANFEQVELETQQILEGDGYSNFVKPFRTQEDLHVLAAVIGFRIGEAIDSNWSHESIEAHLCLLASLTAIKPSEFNLPSSHLILAGCRSQLKTLIKQTDLQFEKYNPEGYKNWKRDKALLEIASKAHKLRTSRAWGNFKTT